MFHVKLRFSSKLDIARSMVFLSLALLPEFAFEALQHRIADALLYEFQRFFRQELNLVSLSIRSKTQSFNQYTTSAGLSEPIFVGYRCTLTFAISLCQPYLTMYRIYKIVFKIKANQIELTRLVITRLIITTSLPGCVVCILETKKHDKSWFRKNKCTIHKNASYQIKQLFSHF